MLKKSIIAFKTGIFSDQNLILIQLCWISD